MGFLLGLLLGSAAVSGSSNHPALSLGSIPLRCLAAAEESDDAYRRCRRLSMSVEVYQQYTNTDDSLSGVDRYHLHDAVEDGMGWELKALHEMEDAAKAKANPAHQAG